MCGISGLVNWGDLNVLQKMNEIQSHRGPDDRGVWSKVGANGQFLGLGNCRLAIQDVSKDGHMPMSNEDETIFITYNGEIFNFPKLREELIGRGHAFRSGSDTEVILQLYQREGIQFVERLKGMFAIAIYDLRSDSWFFVRDHFGIKPFYYLFKDGRLAFASEMKTFKVLPGFSPRLDIASLHQYMTFLWVPEPNSILEGVKKLPAGHYATFQSGKFTLHKYWDLDFPAEDHSDRYLKNENEVVKEVRRLFGQSVSDHMISDVSVGAFLSGGLDSSAIVSQMASISNDPVSTYTIVFPEKDLVGESSLDDPKLSRMVADHFGCDHHEIIVEPDVADLMGKLAWHLDEPIADPAAIMSYLVCQEAGKNLKVMLSGVGGDELFAGYRKHYAYRWAKFYKLIPRFVRESILSPGIASLPVMRGTPFKNELRLIKKMVMSGSMSDRDAFLMNCTYLDDIQKSNLYSRELKTETADYESWKTHLAFFNNVSHADFLNQMLYLDVKTFMVSLNLTYNDRMSMASSVETRIPFLDKDLVEFVAQHVSPNMKLKGSVLPQTKYILRKAMDGILPEKVLNQSKAGFGAPIDKWLSHDLKDMVSDLLNPKSIEERGYFDSGTVSNMLMDHQRGKRDWAMQIWQLLTLELWHQSFMDN